MNNNASKYEYLGKLIKKCESLIKDPNSIKFSKENFSYSSRIGNSFNFIHKIREGELKKALNYKLRSPCISSRSIISCSINIRNFLRFYCKENDKNVNSSNNAKKYDKYHIALWNRIKTMPTRLRNFVVKGPLTVHKILPIFNIMFFSVATGVLIATTTIVSVGVWVANRNERWQGIYISHFYFYLY